MKLNLIRKEYKNSNTLEIKTAILRYYKKPNLSQIKVIFRRNDFYSDENKSDSYFFFYFQLNLDTHLNEDYIGNNLSKFDIKENLRFLHNSYVYNDNEGIYKYGLYSE